MAPNIIFPSSATRVGQLGETTFYPNTIGSSGTGGFPVIETDGTTTWQSFYWVTNIGANAGICRVTKVYDGDWFGGWPTWGRTIEIAGQESTPSEDQTDTPGLLTVSGLTPPVLMFHQVDPGNVPSGEGGERSGIQIATSSDLDPTSRTWTRYLSTYVAQPMGTPETAAFIRDVESEINQWQGGLSEPTAVWDGTQVQMFCISHYRPAGSNYPVLSGQSGSFKWVLTRWVMNLEAGAPQAAAEYVYSPAFPVFDPETDIPEGVWGQARGNIMHPHVMHDSANELLHLFITRDSLGDATESDIGHFVSPAPADNPSVWGAKGTWIPNPNNPLLTPAMATPYNPNTVKRIAGPFALIDPTAEKLYVGGHASDDVTLENETTFVMAEFSWPSQVQAAARQIDTDLLADLVAMGDELGASCAVQVDTVSYNPATGAGTTSTTTYPDQTMIGFGAVTAEYVSAGLATADSAMAIFAASGLPFTPKTTSTKVLHGGRSLVVNGVQNIRAAERVVGYLIFMSEE